MKSDVKKYLRRFVLSEILLMVYSLCYMIVILSVGIFQNYNFFAISCVVLLLLTILTIIGKFKAGYKLYWELI